MTEIIRWFWDDGIFYGLYSGVILSIIYILKQFLEAPIRERVSQWNYRYRLRKIRYGTSSIRVYQHPLLKHLQLTLRTTNRQGKAGENELLPFLIVTILLFLSTFVMVLLPLKDVVLALVLALLVAVIPYMFLHLRLVKLRYLLGEEFLNIVHKLQQNYNSNHFDMYHALVETQKSIEQRALRKVMLQLISDLQISKNEEELRMSIQTFVFTAGSSWSKRLGNIILKGYMNNENVLNTLMTLSRQMEDTEEMLEEEKSNTMDAVVNGMLTFPVFIASLLLGYYVSGPQDWFTLQFGNEWTVTLLIICIIGVVFSLFISKILKRPKNDL